MSTVLRFLLTAIAFPASVQAEASQTEVVLEAGEVGTATVATPFPSSAEWDSTQVTSSRAMRGLTEPSERLSGKTQRRDAKGGGKRIAFKLVSGTLSGIGVSFGGLFLSSGMRVRGWDSTITWSVLIGYPVGSAIGVSLVDPHDRFIHSLIGSLLGVGVTALAASEINFLVFPPICATLASEMFRKPPEARRFSIGLVPNSTGHLSAVAALRF